MLEGSAFLLCLGCHFSGKLMSEGAKNMGSGSARVGFFLLVTVLSMGLQAVAAHPPPLSLS